MSHNKWRRVPNQIMIVLRATVYLISAICCYWITGRHILPMTLIGWRRDIWNRPWFTLASLIHFLPKRIAWSWWWMMMSNRFYNFLLLYDFYRFITSSVNLLINDTVVKLLIRMNSLCLILCYYTRMKCSRIKVLL